MKTYRLSTIAPEEQRTLLSRSLHASAETELAVRALCLDVKQNGDAAVRACTEKFDGVRIESFRVPESHLDEALARLAPDLRTALEQAASNIRSFHAKQLRDPEEVETLPGVMCRRERRPIARVGLYVPAGSAPLPSTVLMLGIPALLAACPSIALCAPPQKDGSIEPTILAAARLIGIREIYRVGGAQAIAALAYGTESIAKTDKIFGPGNRFVAAAKQFVSTDPDGAAIDMLAGPSELLVLADDSADPSFVAADLLSQAEHDPDARVVLVTTSESLGKRVSDLVETALARLPRRITAARALAGSSIVLADSEQDAVAFSNAYAPEHLSIQMKRAESITAAITSAGSVFVGPWSPVTAGDYASGTNHTLPTGGTARNSSGVSVEMFQKTITFQRLTREGLRALSPTLVTLARAEGLDAHARAVEVRL